MNPEALAISAVWAVEEIAHVLRAFDVHDPDAVFELDELCRMVAHLQRLERQIVAHVEGLPDVSTEIQKLREAAEAIARAACCLD